MLRDFNLIHAIKAQKKFTDVHLYCLLIFIFLMAPFTMATEKISSQAPLQTLNTKSAKKTNLSAVKLKTKKSFTKDIDKTITNKELRTLTGSKSKYSMSIGSTYIGGSILQPFGKIRPSIFGDSQDARSTNLSGTVSLRYRLSSHGSISAGSGISFLRPWHENNNTSLSDPFLAYTTAYKLGPLQVLTIPKFTLGTSNSSREVSRIGHFDFTNFFYNKLYDSRLTVGMVFTYRQYDYYSTADPESTNYLISLLPLAEYKLTDTYALKTLLSYSFSHGIKDKSQSPFDMHQGRLVQAVGVRISVNRDMNLYPSILFTPKNLVLADTNFSLNLTMNAF